MRSNGISPNVVAASHGGACAPGTSVTAEPSTGSLLDRPPAPARLMPSSTTSAVENVLSLRELRFPPDDWGQTPVVCGRSQFSITKYVPNPALRTTTRIMVG